MDTIWESPKFRRTKDRKFFFLGGRYAVESAAPFTSLEIGLTVEGGGWLFDNLMFDPQYHVRHVAMDADAVVPVTPGTSVRVSVLGDPTLDVTTIVPSSLALGPGAAPARRTRVHDVDRDGDPDLVAVFDVNAAGITCGSTSVYLTGRTLSGEMLYARDDIRTRCGPAATIAAAAGGEEEPR